MFLVFDCVPFVRCVCEFLEGWKECPALPSEVGGLYVEGDAEASLRLSPFL